MAIVWTQDDLDKLKAAYLALATGERVVSISQNDGGNARTLTFSNATKKDLKELIDEVALSLCQQAGRRSGSFTLRTSKGL